MLRSLPPPSPVPNAPQPLLDLLLKESGPGNAPVTLPTTPSRQSFAAFHRLRARAVRWVSRALFLSTRVCRCICRRRQAAHRFRLRVHAHTHAHTTHNHRSALAPLLPTADHHRNDTEALPLRKEQQPQPQSLVSQYFQAHDALAVLRASGEAADALLAQQLAPLRLECDADEGEGAAIQGEGRKGDAQLPLAPVALVLALHVLHRLVQG